MSFNECLETGTPLQNSLYDILVRSRMRPIILCGDIQKAFWQIRIRELDINLLRFYWIKILDPNIVEINRFNRLVFGLTQGTLKVAFSEVHEWVPYSYRKNSERYVCWWFIRGHKPSWSWEFKIETIELFSKGEFNLHKWHSNIPLLENDNTNSEQT